MLPDSAAALPPHGLRALRLPHCSGSVLGGWKEGRERKQSLSASAYLKELCCRHHYRKVLTSSTVLHVLFHLLPQLFL